MVVVFTLEYTYLIYDLQTFAQFLNLFSTLFLHFHHHQRSNYNVTNHCQARQNYPEALLVINLIKLLINPSGQPVVPTSRGTVYRYYWEVDKRSMTFTCPLRTKQIFASPRKRTD
jgi:hypothetical protein